MPMPTPMAMPIASPSQSIPMPAFDMNNFTTIQDQSQLKQMIGNAVYTAIIRFVGDNYAGKITGMVIEENAVNQQMLMSDQVYFDKNINEAFKLLGGQ
jgi:hypothetical protein